MTPVFQLRFDCLELGHQPLLRRLAPYDERSILPALPTVMREAQKREGLRLSLSRFVTPGPAVPHTATGLPVRLSFGDRGEHAVFFMANMDKLDFSVAPQRIDHRVQRVSDDAVAALDA